MEKSVPRITVWHHEACRVMPNSDCEGRIFLSTLKNHDIICFLHINAVTSIADVPKL